MNEEVERVGKMRDRAYLCFLFTLPTQVGLFHNTFTQVFYWDCRPVQSVESLVEVRREWIKTRSN